MPLRDFFRLPIISGKGAEQAISDDASALYHEIEEIGGEDEKLMRCDPATLSNEDRDRRRQIIERNAEEAARFQHIQGFDF